MAISLLLMDLREPEKPRWCFLSSPRSGRAALEKSEPPVIIATSTNNQAVTNIIEAFGKDFHRALVQWPDDGYLS